MEFKDLTILELQELKQKCEISYYELSEYYFKRIKNYNKHTNSIATKNPKALETAKQRDAEYHEGVDLLYGMPILIKDNINTIDMKTTAGAVILKDFYAKDDAFIIKQLKEKGAIILGKTNLSEFANFISWDSKNGHSALKGQVINPYGKDLDVGGSSSGSGAAIATSLAVAAIGTETSGSILSPALQNSIVGLKPSVGVVSREGIIPISPTQDVPGPMARNVLDAAILFNGITGIDKNDPSTIKNIKVDIENIKKSIKGLRLGYVQSSLITDASIEEKELTDNSVKMLKTLGAEIVEFHHTKPDQEANFDILFHEFPKALNNFLKNEPNAPVLTLEEIIAFNKENPDERIPFGQPLFEKCLEMDEKDYEQTVKFDQKIGNQLINKMQQEQIDALIFTGYFGTWLPAKAGMPSIVVPAGYINERPFGITFTSLKMKEELLFRIAYQFEQAANVRKEPGL